MFMDLDEVVLGRDICTTLKNQLNLKKLGEECILNLRIVYGGTQMTLLSAQELFTVKRVYIEWVVLDLSQKT